MDSLTQTRFFPDISMTYDQYHWSFPSTRQIPWHFHVFQKRGHPELTTENNDDWLTGDAKLLLMYGSRSATRRAQGIHRSALYTASKSSTLVSGVHRWTKLMHVRPGYYWDGWLSSGGNTISVCNQPTRSTQPCIPPESSTSFGWGKGGNVTSAGWQVTPCDPTWHVSSHSGVTTLRTAIHLLLTYTVLHKMYQGWFLPSALTETGFCHFLPKFLPKHNN